MYWRPSMGAERRLFGSLTTSREDVADSGRDAGSGELPRQASCPGPGLPELPRTSRETLLSARESVAREALRSLATAIWPRFGTE